MAVRGRWSPLLYLIVRKGKCIFIGENTGKCENDVCGNQSPTMAQVLLCSLLCLSSVTGLFQKIIIKRDFKIKLFVLHADISTSVMPKLLCWISITRTCTTAKWLCDSMTRILPRRMLNLRRCVNKCTLFLQRKNNDSKRLGTVLSVIWM